MNERKQINFTIVPDDTADLPDPKVVAARLAKINADPRLTH